MARDSKGFTQHQRNIAVDVLAKSDAVKTWVEGQARAYDVDLTTPDGKAFFERVARQYARKFIR